MMRRYVLWMGIVLIAFATPPMSLAQTQAPRFPQIVSMNLERQRVSLPGELLGQYNLVVIAYRQEQQAVVDTWMPALNALEDAGPYFRWYELPTISKLTGFFVSWWLDDAMRSGIPDRRQRERTITIYVDKEWFRTQLGLPQNDDTIHLLLLDRSGGILWRRDGRFDAPALEDLAKTLRALP